MQGEGKGGAGASKSNEEDLKKSKITRRTVLPPGKPLVWPVRSVPAPRAVTISLRVGERIA